MTPQANLKVTPEEYLALERQAEHKSEYHEGEIFAMAGATPEHVLIVSNIVTLLNVALGDRPYMVFSSDMRLQVDPTGEEVWLRAVECHLKLSDVYRRLDLLQ